MPVLNLRQGDNEDMTEKEAIRRWAQIWKELGPELEKIHLREVRDETICSL